MSRSATTPNANEQKGRAIRSGGMIVKRQASRSTVRSSKDYAQNITSVQGIPGAGPSLV
jgi:hypothetical protein